MEVKNLVQKMINDYETILSLVSQKLNELKQFAQNNNFQIENKPVLTQNYSATTNPLMEQMENQRKQMMAEMEKIRNDAQAQAQKAMADAQASMKNKDMGMPNMGGMGMPNMGGMGMPNMGGMGMPNINLPNIESSDLETKLQNEEENITEEKKDDKE